MIIYRSIHFSEDVHLIQKEYKLAVMRSLDGELLDQIFTIVVTVVVIFNTFLMGTQLELKTILKVVKRPIGPVIAFFCQYALMPMVRAKYKLYFLTSCINHIGSHVNALALFVLSTPMITAMTKLKSIDG